MLERGSEFIQKKGLKSPLITVIGMLSLVGVVWEFLWRIDVVREQQPLAGPLLGLWQRSDLLLPYWPSLVGAGVVAWEIVARFRRKRSPSAFLKAVWRIGDVAEKVDLLDRTMTSLAEGTGGVKGDQGALANQLAERLDSLERTVTAAAEDVHGANRDLKTLANLVHSVTNPLLFRRLAELESNEGIYYIYYSHKGKQHKTLPGDGEHYQAGPFPYDEVQSIVWLWTQIVQTLPIAPHQVRFACSCTYGRNQTGSLKAMSSFAVIGSPKENAVCRDVMEKLRDHEYRVRDNRYLMDVGRDPLAGERNAYLKEDRNGSRGIWPTSTKNKLPNEVGTDYAVFMRVQNVLNAGRGSILVMAGCKVAGQVALLDWLSNPTNISRFVKECGNGDGQLGLEVSYAFVPQGLPRIQSVEELFLETLSFRNPVR